MDELYRDMVEGIENKKRSEISHVRFICDYASKHRNVIGDVSDKEAYQVVERSIKRLHEECLPHIGVTCYDSNYKSLEILLGLVTLHPKFGALCPTNDGRSLIEEYSKAMGLVNLDEQVKIRRERLHKLFTL